ncbi:hypothetical protein DFH06DRAFT_1427408 [Mycena polygramma]|nr:hypothetical protein DFH06DRAFT_1427403 [Mycena polygramma]KAJ7642723.1 hypothetical protein DFH06DRAFT_1427408 [Mycena polygramma]
MYFDSTSVGPHTTSKSLKLIQLNQSINPSRPTAIQNLNKYTISKVVFRRCPGIPFRPDALQCFNSLASFNILLHDLDSCAQSRTVKNHTDSLGQHNRIRNDTYVHTSARRRLETCHFSSPTRTTRLRAPGKVLCPSLVKKARASQTATVLDHPPHSRKSLVQIDLRMADFIFRGLHPASANPPLSTCVTTRRALREAPSASSVSSISAGTRRWRGTASDTIPRYPRVALQALHNARPSPTGTAHLRPPSAVRLGPPELAHARINPRWPRDFAALRIASHRKTHAAGVWPARMRSPRRVNDIVCVPGTMRVPALPSARQRGRSARVVPHNAKGARRPAQRQRRGAAHAPRIRAAKPSAPLRSADKRSEVARASPPSPTSARSSQPRYRQTKTVNHGGGGAKVGGYELQRKREREGRRDDLCTCIGRARARAPFSRLGGLFADGAVSGASGVCLRDRVCAQDRACAASAVRVRAKLDGARRRRAGWGSLGVRGRRRCRDGQRGACTAFCAGSCRCSEHRVRRGARRLAQLGRGCGAWKEVRETVEGCAPGCYATVWARALSDPSPDVEGLEGATQEAGFTPVRAGTPGTMWVMLEQKLATKQRHVNA